MLWLFAAEQMLASDPAGKAIGITTLGANVETGLVERVGRYVEAKYCARVSVRQPGISTNFAVGSLLKVSTTLLQTNDAFLVVLTSVPGKEPVVKLDDSIVCVSLGMLKPAEMDTAQALEQYSRRVEKEAMRAVGLMLGLTNCPNVLCVLSLHRNQAELDAKGCALCPPCLLFKAEEALKGKGVDLIKPKKVLLKRK